MPEKIIEHSSKKMYIDDMVKYAIIVDRRRAFPEVRDGLKPVQRRVIYDMFQQGAISYNKRLKSAKITGDTMGLYSPHSSCLRGDTVIYDLSGKFHRIKDVYESGIQSIHVLSVDQNGSIVPSVAHSFRIGQLTNKVYHFELSNGSSLCCTANHPILTKYNGWVKAEDIKLDTLLYSYGISNISTDKPSVRESYKEYIDENIKKPLYLKKLGVDEIVVIRTRYNAFDLMGKQGYNLSSISYNDYLNSRRILGYDSISEEDFNISYKYYSLERPFITNIWVEDVEQEPMYDFTVDDYANMIVTVGTELNLATNQIPFICVHNSAIYQCMEPLANWYKCKVPLIAGHGNWGTIMGDGQAAERYTEAGLTDFCYDTIISELKDAKYIVDWKDNYDRKTVEPEYLPCKIPILMINGAFGIGVGLSVNIPPHNMVEVLEATRALIRNKNTDIVLIPDHCQDCEIINADWKTISHTGVGKYKVRGKVSITEEKGYPVLYITSLPDNVSTSTITAKIEDMIAKNQLPMIKDYVDPSKERVNIKITLKKGSDPNYVKQILYTHTQVQVSVSVNFQAVKDVDPMRYNDKSYLLEFIENRALTKFRLYCNKYKDASTRAHKLDAYIKVIESGEIDNIIKMVKKQKTIDDNELVEFLIKKVGITDLQAGFILATDIRRLSYGYLSKYKEEFKQLEKDKEVYRKAITDDGSIIMNEIDQELLDIEKRYGSPRTCKVISAKADLDIPKGIFKVVVTEKNYIRKIPDTDKVGIVRGDNPKFILRVDNTENVLLFDNMGKVFKLPIYKIPVSDRSNAGTDSRILVKNMTADIIAAYYEPSLKKVIEGKRKHYIVVVSKQNIIKKLDMEDFLNVNTTGLMYSKLKDGDQIAGICVAPADLDITVYSKQKALRTQLKDIPLLKRNAAGSKAMNTNDELEGISVIYPDANYILVVTSNGKMNKFDISGMMAHNRARSGINVIKLAEGDSIFSIFGVNDSDIIRVVSSGGVAEIPTTSIQCKSSIASGQKVTSIKGVIIRCDIIR